LLLQIIIFLSPLSAGYFIRYNKSMRLLGAHMSVAGGVDQALERGAALGCTAIQIFVKNNNRWLGQNFSSEEIIAFKKAQKETGIFVFAHTGYLINLAATDPDNEKKSLASLRQELDLAEALGLPFTVLHPGSHLGQGEFIGLAKVATNLKKILKETKGYKVKILLENTAGQGTNLGHRFEHLAKIMELAGSPDRLAVCFDTCHAFASGYDIKSPDGYQKVWENFERMIGFPKLLAFHLNDCLGGLGSKKDRHQHIGLGELGKEAFARLLNDQRFVELPMVLETPKDETGDADRANLELLRSLIK
jgi:deoxyribonuclease-4